MTLTDSIDTLTKLIQFPSVSDTSNESISEWVSDRLSSLGFVIEVSDYVDSRNVRKVNVVARREPASGTSHGGIAYFCHTDVVPAVGWTGPGGDPFAAVQQDGKLYGRGSCDMKGSLVAMMAAASTITASKQTAPLWIVCTADEEIGFLGAKQLVSNSDAYRQLVDAQPLGIIGEPTRLQVVHAHKGIDGFRITSRGRAAHSSMSTGINANEAIVPILQTLLEISRKTRSDPVYQDSRFDPPVLSWNFGVSDHSTAVNITPEKSTAWVSLRSMPGIDGEDLVQQVKDQAESLGLEFTRHSGGSPVWIEPDAPCIQSMCQIAGGQPTTVCYGTDGGEFTELSQRVVFGPGDIVQAHTTDEWIDLQQLEQGIDLYGKMIARWCT